MTTAPHSPLSRRERREQERRQAQVVITPDVPQLAARKPRNASHAVVADRYVVSGQAGAGEMSTVFAARDNRLRRQVAIKMLSPELAFDPEARAAFFAEARIYAELQHTGLMSIYDMCGEDESDVPWMVLEHIDGVTLTQALRARRQDTELPQAAPFSLDRSLALLEVFLDALRHAHERGIAHRDISPANIMLTRDGGIRIVDFGLAVNAANKPGTVRGTAHFMSPEHAAGERADARSDVYAMTCVFFAMLTGRPPFLGPDSTSVALAHRETPAPSLLSLAPSAPEWVNSLVDRGLTKAPTHRFRDAGHMLDELQIYRMAHSGEGGLVQTAREHVVDIVRDTDRVFGTGSNTTPSTGQIFPNRAPAPAAAPAATPRPTAAAAEARPGMTRREFRRLQSEQVAHYGGSH